MSFLDRFKGPGKLIYRGSAVVMFFFAELAVMISPLIRVPNQHYLLSTTYISFANIMACRVFRGVALGRLESNSTQVGLTSTNIHDVFGLLEAKPPPVAPRQTLDTPEAHRN